MQQNSTFVVFIVESINMTEFEAKKVVLKNIEGDYIAPVAYSAMYDKDGDTIDISSLNTDVSGKVSKSGDKMTGTLEFDKSMTTTSTLVPCVRANMDYTVNADNPPVSNIFVRKESIYDNDDKLLYSERLRLTTANILSRFFTVQNYDAQGEMHSAELGLHCYPDGSAGFAFPKCETKPTKTSSATTSKVAVVVKNYLNGNSWYRVWSDGFIEQGGLSTGVNSKSITFLKPFSNANYTLIASIINESNYSYSPMLNNKTANGFSYQINYGGTSNVTGDCNYYACGY